jgi:outer membrane protein TolC
MTHPQNPFLLPFALCRLPIALLCLLSPAAGQTLSEQDAIHIALERDRSVRVARISRATDSLTLEQSKAAYLPTLALGSTLSWAPKDTATLSADISAAGSQAIPGGGSLSGSVTPLATRNLTTATLDGSTGYALTLRQPLAAGAWRYGQPGYDLRVQRLTSAEANAGFRKDLAAELSSVRRLFWSAYERTKELAIAREALAQSERMLTNDRARFAVGEIAVIDTLGTALAWLQAQQDALSAEIAFTQARRDLAEALASSADSVVIPESLDVTVADLPQPAELLAAARAYDPSRTLFELAYEKLQLQLGQRRNDLLPQVDLQASYAYDDALSSSASLRNNSVFALIASYALPTRSKRIDAAKARLSAEQNRIEAAQHDRELDNSAAALVENWSIEQRRLTTAQTAAEVARRRLQAAQKGYEVGSIDQLAYLQARKDAFDNQTRALQQLVALKRLEITFDELTGNVFSRFGVHVQ